MRLHPDAKASLDAWLKNVSRAIWKSFQELRASYPSADRVLVNSDKHVIIFNIAHNRYRLITGVHFNHSKVFVLRFLTHKEYDRNQWKVEL